MQKNNIESESNTDAVLPLAIELIRRPSLTPEDAGCQDYIANRLAQRGFQITHLPFGEPHHKVQNMWATHGTGSPVLCFVGHTDVVPTGNEAYWDTPPFEPTLKDGYLYGRGAADMKGSVASMVVACENFVAQHPEHSGTIAVLLTSDEEGPSEYGVKAVVEHFKKINQTITWAIIGEPSSKDTLGDIIKYGRRGTMNGHLTIHGKQGHIAYPKLARNPISLALPAVTELTQQVWDEGSVDFDPTSFQISNINAGTGANNVIPQDLIVKFNFRFSPSLTPENIQQTVESVLEKHKLEYTLNWNLSGLPFITDKNSVLIQATMQVLKEHGVSKPLLSTTGGTSDGRFIAGLGADIVELGPINATIHQINECVYAQDLNTLALWYQKIASQLLVFLKYSRMT